MGYLAFAIRKSSGSGYALRLDEETAGMNQIKQRSWVFALSLLAISSVPLEVALAACEHYQNHGTYGRVSMWSTHYSRNVPPCREGFRPRDWNCQGLGVSIIWPSYNWCVRTWLTPEEKVAQAKATAKAKAEAEAKARAEQVRKRPYFNSFEGPTAAKAQALINNRLKAVQDARERRKKVTDACKLGSTSPSSLKNLEIKFIDFNQIRLALPQYSPRSLSVIDAVAARYHSTVYPHSLLTEATLENHVILKLAKDIPSGINAEIKLQKALLDKALEAFAGYGEARKACITAEADLQAKEVQLVAFADARGELAYAEDYVTQVKEAERLWQKHQEKLARKLSEFNQDLDKEFGRFRLEGDGGADTVLNVEQSVFHDVSAKVLQDRERER